MAFVVNCLCCGTPIMRSSGWIESERRLDGRKVEIGSLLCCSNCQAVYELVLSERRPSARVARVVAIPNLNRG